jgi:hypothetical protein
MQRTLLRTLKQFTKNEAYIEVLNLNGGEEKRVARAGRELKNLLLWKPPTGKD